MTESTAVAHRETPPEAVRFDLTNEAYHAMPEVSSTQLKTLLDKSPAHLKFGVRKASAAMAKGSLIHTAVLEPELFDASYIVCPDVDKRTKEWKAFLAEAGTRIPITVEDRNTALAISDTLSHSHELRPIFAAEPLIEASVFWTDATTGERCRCRPDLWLRGALLLDLKSIADASGDNPRKAIERFGYALSAAYYSDGVFAATGERLPFLFVFTETESPYAYRLIELDGEYLDLGRKQYQRALLTYSECRKRNIWPAFPTAIQRLEPSVWFRKAVEAGQIIPTEEDF